MNKVVIRWQDEQSFSMATRDAQVEVTEGSVSLLKRVLLTDEMGNCTGRDVELIDSLNRARKDFWLDSTEVDGARVSAWLRCGDRQATLIVEVNGHPLTIHASKSHREADEPPGADYWHTYWRTVEVPVEYLRAGRNQVVFYTQDGSRWELLIESNRQPNRSARSVDGGLTWDDQHLGYNGCYDGEYLVRMELDRYPSLGRITSPVFDLAAAASRDSLGCPITIEKMSARWQGETPPGTGIELELRAGTTPVYDPKHWSPWQPADGFVPRPGDRFAQWRATLETCRPLETPLLRAVHVTVEVEDEAAEWADLRDADNPPILYPSHPFGYQPLYSRTQMMRERWQLDKVVSEAQNDFEAILQLARWARGRWRNGWDRDWNQIRFCPPWDGPLILEMGRYNLGVGMCTHYATVFVHACASLGITARHVIHKCHCTAEAWSDHLGKWVWIDIGGDTNDETRAVYHLERHGIPLSFLEARMAWLSGESDELRMVGRNAEKVFDLQDRLALMDRFCIVLRNDQMLTPYPGELEHGIVAYHYDGYLWWRDADTSPLPYFTLSSSREGDFYWTLNRTHIHLQRTKQRGVLRVHLESSMPNMKKHKVLGPAHHPDAIHMPEWPSDQIALQIRMDDRDWQNSAAEFEWALHKGVNRLEARSVNAFGVEGPVSWVVVTFP